ncbi:MAG: chemotaxis-specific protein-glutamate methyltransferase CheB [Coleofasciculaceae cyanobacterium]
MSIKVLLVEDSQIALTILKRILNSSPEIEVVGEARTGLEGLEKIPQVNPDVICTDLHMPVMDGLEFTSEVMTLYPKPILVISVSVQEEDTHRVFQLLEAGAVDIFPKPSAGLAENNHLLRRQLIDKVKILSGVRVFKKKRKLPITANNLNSKNIDHIYFKSHPSPKILAVGASTGGPLVLQELFSQLPADFPLPIICVQHICNGFLQGLVDWLNSSCRLSIEIAKPGDRPERGKIYFPQEQQHLELDANGRFICSDSPAVDGHRPSVTVMFESVVKFYGRKTLAVLLTGMGKDGAKGMLTISKAGGFTIAQDQATSVVFGMPKEAIDLGAAKLILPASAIAPRLLDLITASRNRF